MNTNPAVVNLNHVNAKHDKELAGVNPGLLAAFEGIITYLGRNNDLTDSEKANFADTAVRAAKAFAGLTATRTQISEALREIMQTGFPREDHDENYEPGLITQGPVQVFSYCPHHLLPVEYQAYVAYIPGEDGKVLGLSKLARIAKLLGQRPVLQEQLASDIADVLCAKPPARTKKAKQVHHSDDDAVPQDDVLLGDAESLPVTPTTGRFPGIDSKGSAVLLTGKHSCMTCRGVASDALTSVSELRGVFWNEGFEQKFYQAVSAINSSTLR